MTDRLGANDGHMTGGVGASDGRMIGVWGGGGGTGNHHLHQPTCHVIPTCTSPPVM